MRKTCGYLLEIVGIGAAIGGLFLIAMWLGLVAVGVALVFAGAVIGSDK